MPRRPAGVILSAVVLGLAAGAFLLMALGSLITGVFAGHPPSPDAAIALSAPPSPAFFKAISLVMAFFYLALAGWAIATIVGLLRLQPWARISILIIGGGLAALSLFSALGCFAMPALSASLPLPPNGNPALLRTVFIAMGIFFLVIAAIGIAWLIYFSLRRIREAFLPPPPAPPIGYPYAPPPLPHAHTLDYSSAQPFYTQPLAPPPPPAYLPPQPLPLASTTQPRRPISITILAVFFLLAGTFSIPSLFLPFPLFFLGALVHGWAAHLLMLLMACWIIAAGIGMLKLQKPAWYMALAYCALGLGNTAVMLLPVGRRHLIEYMQQLTSVSSMGTTPALNLFQGPFINIFLIPGILFGFAVTVFVIILLWRARWAFGPSTATAADQADA